MASRVLISVLPSPILASGNPESWQPFEINHTDRIAVYPPIASEGPGRSQHPAINFDKLFQIIPTNGGHVQGMPPSRLLPGLNVESSDTNSFTLIQHDAPCDEDHATYPFDTVTYEIFGKNDGKAYFEGAMRNLRRFTRQAWIREAAAYLDSPSTAGIDLDDARTAYGQIVYGFGLAPTAYQSIRLCTEELWREAWRLAVESSEDLGVDLINRVHDALLTHSLEEFCLQAGLAIERLKYLLWDHLKASGDCGKPEHRAALNDTKEPNRYFSEVLAETCGRSLLEEHPEANVSVKKLWIARGRVAHGKELNEPWDMAPRLEHLCNLYTLARFVDSVRGKPWPSQVL